MVRWAQVLFVCGVLVSIASAFEDIEPPDSGAGDLICLKACRQVSCIKEWNPLLPTPAAECIQYDPKSCRVANLRVFATDKTRDYTCEPVDPAQTTVVKFCPTCSELCPVIPPVPPDEVFSPTSLDGQANCPDQGCEFRASYPKLKCKAPTPSGPGPETPP
jgi:hypothetical protein